MLYSTSVVIPIFYVISLFCVKMVSLLTWFHMCCTSLRTLPRCKIRKHSLLVNLTQQESIAQNSVYMVYYIRSIYRRGVACVLGIPGYLITFRCLATDNICIPAALSSTG